MNKELIIETLRAINKILNDGRLEDGERTVIASAKISDLLLMLEVWRIMKEIEFRIIDDEALPPMIINKNEDDSPKVILNNYHKIWLCLNRATIAGIFDVLPKKITELLDAYLREQYGYEIMDRRE